MSQDKSLKAQIRCPPNIQWSVNTAALLTGIKGGISTVKELATNPRVAEQFTSLVDNLDFNTPKTWIKSTVDGRAVYKNNNAFDPNFVDDKGMTNIQRMKEGFAPIGKDGKPIELHHMTQSEVNGFNGSRGALAEVTKNFHVENYDTIHIYTRADPAYISWRRNNPTAAREYDKYRKSYWKQRVKDFEGD